jgi:hypothetical protein
MKLDDRFEEKVDDNKIKTDQQMIKEMMRTFRRFIH